MKSGPLLDRIVLSLVLLLEALISKAITGTALHEALLLAAVAIFMGVRWIGPATAHLAGIVLATMIGVGGWWLLERGEVPVLFSDLPVAFHLAVGLQVWAWAARSLGRQPARWPAARARPGSRSGICSRRPPPCSGARFHRAPGRRASRRRPVR
ncbi:MAG: hypothetical protein KDL87_20560, partial [Verrucomicrobiae bacterium]|nr:hypothetical protein [Verrucomicrobiae bacterium]